MLLQTPDALNKFYHAERLTKLIIEIYPNNAWFECDKKSPMFKM